VLYRRLLVAVVICATVTITLFLSSRRLSAQNSDQGANPQAATPTPYNPYPPGILPSDLNSEIARVQREIRGIFRQYLAQWRALPAPMPAANPPTLQGSGYAAVRILGGLLNYDLNMSPFKNEACASCHMPYAGFSGPIPSVNLTMIAYPGSFHYRAGKRTAQRYTYSPDFPVLKYNTTQGAFFGGNFWDARSTGYKLQSPDAEQAQHPPVDTQEMALPDTACIAYRISQANYLSLFETVWGDSFNISWPADTETICATPGGAAQFGTSATPIALSPDDRTKANNIFDHWGQSISFLERSDDISPFTSKFDAFLNNAYTLTSDEMAGYKLFRGKANCNSCHLDGRSTAPTPPPPAGTAPDSEDTGAAASTVPLFTCFGYANLGLPKDPRDAFYYQTTPDSFGFTANPGGFTYTDFGLGTFLRSGFGSAPNPNSNWVQYAASSDGKFQTSTARNVALVPPQCPTTEAPGPYFQKEFFHNGYIKSLKQLVHFYNTRDVYPYAVESGECPAGTVEKVTCWPAPEVPQNQDMTIGKLGLTDAEEDQIVAFLETLTDGYTKPYPFVNTYTGACSTGGTAATQGNSMIVPASVLRRMAALQAK
jgi:cytochrome c peroxidase